jgi:6-pyruvoyltetrahydropterin/6-carboxytetrahydropterin synthase
MPILKVRHNIEVAHRLFKTPGKCENIHGHSMWVELEVHGIVAPENDMIAGLDFSVVKRNFRSYLDQFYDHHLVLNDQDPWAGEVTYDGESLIRLPGLVTMQAKDPTTENIALDIRTWAENTFIPNVSPPDPYRVNVSVWETHVNGVYV